MRKILRTLGLLSAVLFTFASIDIVHGQTTQKVRLGNSGTGINNYLLDLGRRLGIFRKNGLDLEAIYVNSGSLLTRLSLPARST